MTWHIEQTSALRHFGCNTYFERAMVIFMLIISRNLHGCCKKVESLEAPENPSVGVSAKIADY